MYAGPTDTDSSALAAVAADTVAESVPEKSVELLPVVTIHSESEEQLNPTWAKQVQIGIVAFEAIAAGDLVNRKNSGGSSEHYHRPNLRPLLLED